MPDGRYLGKICKKKRVGEGKIYYNNGNFYAGDFKLNKMHGMGNFVSYDQNIFYEGEFK